MPVDMTTAVFGLRRYETLVVTPVGGQAMTRTFISTQTRPIHCLLTAGNGIRGRSSPSGVSRQERHLAAGEPGNKRAVASFKVVVVVEQKAVNYQWDVSARHETRGGGQGF